MTADNGPPPARTTDRGDTVIPLHDESATVGKQRVERSRVRVTTRVSEREELVREALEQEEATVTRVPIDREIALRQPSGIRIGPDEQEQLVDVAGDFTVGASPGDALQPPFGWTEWVL